MSTTKPAIVIVPGAWHVPGHFLHLSNGLTQAGFDVHVVNKASTDTARSPGTATFADDIASIREAITLFLPRPIVLVAHSYAGMPCTQAVEGLAASTRKLTGQEGGIVQLVYVAAGLPCAGNSVVNLPLPPPESKTADMREDGTVVCIVDPKPILWADVDAPEDARLRELLVPQSAQTLTGVVTYEAWRDVPSVYMRCSLDKTMSPESQDRLISAVREAGGKIDVRDFESSHSPFASKTKETIALIEELAAK